MFAVVADPGGAALWVRLSGTVTMSDLNERAAAMTCELLLGSLDPGSRIYVNLSGLEAVEMEAQGVLIFLLQRALRIPGVEVRVVAPRDLQRALRKSVMRRTLADPRVRLFECMEDAQVWGSINERPPSRRSGLPPSRQRSAH